MMTTYCTRKAITLARLPLKILGATVLTVSLIWGILLAARAAGDLDTTFDTDGIVTTDISSSNNYGNAVAVQSDGKIVVAGHSYNWASTDAAVVRYNSDGSLDTTFDTDGIVTTDNIGGDNAVAVQSDGKIVVTGYKDNGSNADVAVLRYNSDGSLDTTFDTDGIVTTDISSGYDFGSDVAVQSDGKIVVAGSSDNGSNADVAVLRYNSDGSLDTTFDTDGIVTTDIISNSNDIGNAVAVQSDGKIVVAGFSDNGSNDDVAVVRYNSDGSLDTTFDTDGIVTTDISSSNNYGYDVAVQSDGKIVVAGYSDNGSNADVAVLRYNSDGSLDTTFDTDGIVTTNTGSTSDYGHSVALQSDGKIVVAGSSHNGSNADVAVLRYNSDGSLDTTFDTDGIVITDISGNGDYGHAVAVQSDGKIVMAGYSHNGSDFDVAVVRYLASSPEINVQGNDQSIPDGDTNPATADNTDFGSVMIGNTPVMRTFTISNSGPADLTLTGTPAVTLTNGTHFSISAQPGSTTVVSNTTTTFQVTFDPAAAGTFTDTVNIANNDSDENPYTFVVSGTGVAVTLNVNIVGNGRVDLDPSGTQESGTANFSSVYTAGTVVTMTATADSGWIFGGWSGDASGTTAFPLLIDSSKVVTATFSTNRIYLPLVLK